MTSKLNGRRLVAARAMARARWILPDPNNGARYVPMASRAVRRARQGKDFIPVYFYTGIRPAPVAAPAPEGESSVDEFYQP